MAKVPRRIFFGIRAKLELFLMYLGPKILSKKEKKISQS